MEAAGFTVDKGMFDMLGGFTVLRLLNMAGPMLNMELTKEDLLAMNAKLNKIKAPKAK